MYLDIGSYYISKYIAKVIYLEKSKRFISWYTESTRYIVDTDTRSQHIFLGAYYFLCVGTVTPTRERRGGEVELTNLKSTFNYNL